MTPPIHVSVHRHDDSAGISLRGKATGKVAISTFTPSGRVRDPHLVTPKEARRLAILLLQAADMADDPAQQAPRP